VHRHFTATNFRIVTYEKQIATITPATAT